MELVHGRARTSGDDHRLAPDQFKLTAPYVKQKDRGDSPMIARRNQVNCPMFFQQFNGSRTHLLCQPVHDFDSGQVAFVHSPVEGLPGERFLMNCAIRVAIKKTAVPVFQFSDPSRRVRNQCPGKLLVIDPFAAFDGVAKMRFNRIAFAQNDVVTTLNHSGTARFADQPLGCHCDAVCRIAVVRMNCSKQTGTAGSENQYFGIEFLQGYRCHCVQLERCGTEEYQPDYDGKHCYCRDQLGLTVGYCEPLDEKDANTTCEVCPGQRDQHGFRQFGERRRSPVKETVKGLRIVQQQ